MAHIYKEYSHVAFIVGARRREGIGLASPKISSIIFKSPYITSLSAAQHPFVSISRLVTL